MLPIDGRKMMAGILLFISSTTRASDRHFVYAYELGKCPSILKEVKVFVTSVK